MEVFMKNVWLFFLVLITSSVVFAQYHEREDVIWARLLDGETITMDGVLDEPAWSKAESLLVWYGSNTGLPQSGYVGEFQPASIKDSLKATVKFLADPPYLWMAFDIPDSSIGGTADWARWDAILMSIKDHASSSRPTLANEYFFTWWYANNADKVHPGTPPRFIGTFGNFDDTTRTDDQRAAWDARWVIKGQTNDDSAPDTSWTVEMRIDVARLGYDFTKAEGEMLEMNFSIWDADWVFSGEAGRVAVSRTSWESMWGNTNEDDVGQVHVNPNVTVNSGSVPVVIPDVIVPNACDTALPVIDGNLDDAIWSTGCYTFDIAYDDSALRTTYPGAGPFRSSQFQEELNASGFPTVLDPAKATFKMFFNDNFLYFSADVNDQLVQSAAALAQMDGIRLFIADRKKIVDGSKLVVHNLEVHFSNGTAKGFEFMPELLDSSATEFAYKLKGATTVDDNGDVDEGYTIEMKVDLSYLGYDADLGDHLLFIGALLADGDSFDDAANNYGTRAWWFREHPWGPALAWAYMDETHPVGIEDGARNIIPSKLELIGNYPNPFNPSTAIYYRVPSAGDVTLHVFNALGQQIGTLKDKATLAGIYKLNFNAMQLSSGIYFYRIEFKARGQASQLSPAGKMVLMK